MPVPCRACVHKTRSRFGRERRCEVEQGTYRAWMNDIPLKAVRYLTRALWHFTASSVISVAMAAVLVFGATGVAGSFITASLVENQASFSKLGIFTSETTAKTKAEELDNLRKQNVEVIIGDLTKEADVVSAYQRSSTPGPSATSSSSSC